MVLKHKRLIKELRQIAKEYGIKVRFRLHKDLEAYYDCVDKEIVIDYNTTKQSTDRVLLSNFFHELAHFLDHKEKKFINYYKASTPLYKLRRIALNAELHTDNRAIKLSKQYYNFRYVKAYRNKEHRQWLKEYYGQY